MKEKVLLSGNTFGATYWSDGKVDATMLPLLPSIGACPYCHEMFWIDDTPHCESSLNTGGEYIKELSYHEYWQALEHGLGNPYEREKQLRLYLWWAGNDAFRRHPSEPIGCLIVYLLTGIFIIVIFRQILVVLLTLVGMGYFIFQDVWKVHRNVQQERMTNDTISQEYLDNSSRVYENMKRLYELLGESEQDRLMKAELLRERGQFSEAQAMLLQPISSEYRDLHNTILQQIQAQNRTVCQVTQRPDNSIR